MPGADPVAILSYGLWTQRYGPDPGSDWRNDPSQYVPTEVIGMMPPGFEFPLMVGPLGAVGPSNRSCGQAALPLIFGGGIRAGCGSRSDAWPTASPSRAHARSGRHREPPSYRLPETNRDVAPRVFTFSEFFLAGGGSTRSHLLDDVGRRVFCPSDRLRQPGKSDAGSRDRPRTEDLSSYRTGRRGGGASSGNSSSKASRYRS